MTTALRTTLALLVAAAPGCRPEAPEPAPTPAAPGSDRADLDLPPLAGAWTVADYLRVRDALVERERTRPGQLPRLTDDGAPLLRKWTDLAAFTAAAGAADVAALLDLGDAAAHVHKLYAAHVARGVDLGDEYIATAALAIHAAATQLPRLVDAAGLDAAGLRAQPVRLEGLQKARHGLALMFLGLLTEAGAAPDRVSPARCAAALAPVAADVSAHLLPEERTHARELVAALAAGGAAADDLATLQAALADDRPRPPVIADLLAEHRSFTRAQQDLLARAAEAMLAPVEVGPERGWTRWAFPEAGFSAAFPQPPNAQSLAAVADDGVTVTTRTLGIKTATGLDCVISCMTRPSPAPGAAARSAVDTTIAGMNLTDVRAVTVDGAAGKEGLGATAASRAVVRVVPVGHGICLVIAEYPTRLAADITADARRFVESFALGGFRG